MKGICGDAKESHPIFNPKEGQTKLLADKTFHSSLSELVTIHEWGSQGMNYEEDESESNVVSLDSYRNWKQYLAWKNPPKSKEEKIKEALAKYRR